MLANITLLILTWNEEANLPRVLDKLGWVKRIVMVDSFSTDQTLEIAKRYSNVEVFQRTFDTFASQTNWGIEQIKTEWVLSIDADYVLTDELIKEISNLDLTSMPDGYFASFQYCVQGKPLRSTLLPPREILFRKGKAKYIQDGHAHKLVNVGASGFLKSFLYHDDRKTLSRWLEAQDKYAILEVEKLFQTSLDKLPLQDKIRKLIFLAPWLIFLHTYLFKGLFLDGWYGLFYCFQRVLAELWLSIRLIEKKIGLSEKAR